MNKKKYPISGDFGQVRLCRTFVKKEKLQTPFQFMDGGWYHCNDLYHIQRPQGQEGYLLFFSLTDGGCVHIGEKKYAIPASSVTILPPGIAHEYYTVSGKWWEFYWLQLGEAHASFMEHLIAEHGYILRLSRTAQMGKLIEELFPERFMTDETIYEIAASQTVSQIFHMMLEDLHMSTRSHKKTDNIVQNIIREIESNYHQNLSMTNLAAQNYISVQHMIRIFHADTGYTPYEYLKKYRLQKAYELLTHSGLSITEIADRTGFSSTNNFIYQFKKERGMSPGSCRRIYT